MDQSERADRRRRRRWSNEERRAIVELSFDPECSVAEVASCFDVVPSQVYGWRRVLRDPDGMSCSSGGTFLPAVIEPAPAPVAATLLEPERSEGRLLPDDLVQVAMKVRDVPVMVAHGANPMLVASVIAALKAAR